LKSRIQVPLTETGIQYTQTGFHGLESRIQDCLGYPYVGQAATVFNVLREKRTRREEKPKLKKRKEKREKGIRT